VCLIPLISANQFQMLLIVIVYKDVIGMEAFAMEFYQIILLLVVCFQIRHVIFGLGVN